MAGSRTGTPTIIKMARKICKIAQTLGASDLQSRTTPEFKTAVDALIAACVVFQLLDDQPAEIDAVAPFGPEDDTGP